jgi:hypothetical protein
MKYKVHDNQLLDCLILATWIPKRISIYWLITVTKLSSCQPSTKKFLAKQHSHCVADSNWGDGVDLAPGFLLSIYLSLNGVDVVAPGFLLSIFEPRISAATEQPHLHQAAK